MKSEVIDKLNQLNRNFYHQVAAEFDNSRQYHWAGWEQLLNYLAPFPENKSLKVLDLAAGNNRFWEFLTQKLPDPKINYLAVDSNKYLLQKGREKRVENTVSHQLELDILDHLRKNTFLKTISSSGFGNRFDLIVSFGFLHHIPSFDLRKKFIDQCLQLLSPHGTLAVSAWQFAADPTQQKKIVDPPMADINPSDLEPNDFILNWQRGTTAYRYCHWVNEGELRQLVTPDGDHTFHSFVADGKSGELNRYLVLTTSQE